MKLQLGLLYGHGRPATPEDLATLLGPWGARPAETAGEVLDGPLAMAYRGDRITHEDDWDIQPLRREAYVLTWDGRLDNREALARRLGLPLASAALAQTADAVLVLEAYLRFGEAILPELVGEFALALYCTRTHELRLARSTCGARPLYYAAQPDRLLWASDFAHLVRLSGAARTIAEALDDAYVLEFLISQPRPDRTPVRTIAAVPANCVLRFVDGRCTGALTLWDPSRIGQLSDRRTPRSDRDYEAECRAQLTEAVGVRLRAQHPVCAELSGGLDSSSVVLTADQVLRATNQSPERVHTLSCVYAGSTTCDEEPFIRAVEARRGRAGHRVSEAEQQITLGLNVEVDARIPFTGLPSPLDCFPGRYPRFAALMRAHGARVLLTGNGGDHLFWSELDGTPLIADALRQGHLGQTHQRCRQWSRLMRVPYLELLLHRALPMALGPLAPRRPRYLPAPLPAWVASRHRRHAAALLADATASRASGGLGGGFKGLPSERAQRGILANLLAQTAAGYFSAYQDIYLSHPFTHRPLLEWCLGVPVGQFLRDGQPRSLMRRAMRELLPPKVATRQSKGVLDEALARALQREWSSVGDLRCWQLCQRGFVEPRALGASLATARLGLHLTNEHLGRVFSLERWLRSLDDAVRPVRVSPVQRRPARGVETPQPPAAVRAPLAVS